MKTNTITSIVVVLVVLIFAGWGTSAFAQDLYSEGELGIPSAVSAIETGKPDHSLELTNSGKGLCLLEASIPLLANADVTYSEGEAGIAIPRALSGTGGDSGNEVKPSTELCMMTGSDFLRTGFDYSLGEAGTLN